jgi:isochorismate pyruvate lyase
VRAAIDRIDREIVALLAERGAFVRHAARVKAQRSDIVDHPRIEDVVAKVRRAAEAEGVDPGLVEAVYRLMIDRFIAHETAQFDRLREGAGEISS